MKKIRAPRSEITILARRGRMIMMVREALAKERCTAA